jgi:hypothetical protein
MAPPVAGLNFHQLGTLFALIPGMHGIASKPCSKQATTRCFDCFFNSGCWRRVNGSATTGENSER